MVFVDVGVAGTSQRQREAAVATDLFEHVVEEADAGRDFGLGLAVEIDRHPNTRLAGHTLHRRDAWCVGEQVRDRRPIVVVGTEPETAHAEIARKLQVGLAVADHRTLREVQRARPEVIEQHADAGFARRRVLVFEVRIDMDGAEADALRFEDLQQQLLRRFEVGQRKTVGAEPILVADHHELVAGGLQLQQRRNHARHQPELGQRIDLEVGGLLDQGAIAVQEQDLAQAHAASLRVSSAASTALFSSVVPMLMRNASASPGYFISLRTMMPAAASCA